MRMKENNNNKINSNNENQREYGEMKLNGMAKRKMLNKLMWPLRSGVSAPIYISIIFRSDNIDSRRRRLRHRKISFCSSKSIRCCRGRRILSMYIFFRYSVCICVSICSSYSLVRMLYSVCTVISPNTDPHWIYTYIYVQRYRNFANKYWYNKFCKFVTQFIHRYMYTCMLKKKNKFT